MADTVWQKVRRFDLFYWLRSRLIPSCRFHVVNTGLEPGWHDVDERMLHACMSLLCSYVEREHDGVEALERRAKEYAGDGYDEHSRVEAEACVIYRWWKYERADDRQQEEDLLMAWCDARPRTETAFRAHTEAEKANDARDQQMLHRLIDIRRSLWT